MRAVFFGLGGAGQRHLRNLKFLYPECEIAAIRSVNRTFEISNDLTANPDVDIMDKYNIRI